MPRRAMIGFTHNRDRRPEAEIARDFQRALMPLPKVKRLMSNEHFSVDATLVDAWSTSREHGITNLV